MPNLGLSELILLLVVLAISVTFIAGVVWLIRSVVGGAERTRIQELEARVRELEQRQL
ncbi:hypothetical protein [Deinococcus marmoris]|uniref:Uncharacterized protein n=1 Tax=Deinococcus marmoris TaxID=249408 RepID=A0A1U7NUI5_9DEIO|nr:hypothetical protein [Deinococcus marmoris]OLV16570.1 hypothetical protein BOO71_0011464 [Deinococcus marmoris]